MEDPDYPPEFDFENDTTMPENTESNILIDCVKLEISETQIVKEEFENDYIEMETIVYGYSDLERTTTNENTYDPDYTNSITTAIDIKFESDLENEMEPIQVVEFEDSCSDTEINVSSLDNVRTAENLEMERIQFKKSDFENNTSEQMTPIQIVEIEDSSSDPERTDTDVSTYESNSETTTSLEMQEGRSIRTNVENESMEIMELKDSSDSELNDSDLMIENTMFWCGPCEEPFKLKRSLKRHMALHTPAADPPECTDCRTLFESVSKLEEHKLLHAKDKIPSKYERLVEYTKLKQSTLKCKVCNRKFKLKSNLDKHMLLHKADSTCYVCNLTFKFPKRLKAHMKMHKEKIPFTCEMCGISFVQKTTFDSHMDKHLVTTAYKCENCPEMFISKKSLGVHIGNCGARKKVRGYKTIQSADESIVEDSSKRAEPVFVDVNNFNEGVKDTNNPINTEKDVLIESLFDVINTDERSTKIKCTQCLCVFPINGDLHVHMSMHRNDLSCNTCNRTFKLKRNLSRHIDTHMQRPTYSHCKLCINECFRKRAEEPVREEVKKSICDICSKEFVCPVKLKANRMVNDDGTYTCVLCQKISFKEIAPLTLHLSTHGFRCVQCMKSVYAQVYSSANMSAFTKID